MAYLPEELLDAPAEPQTWTGMFGRDPLQHPYMYLLFLGQDNDGNMIPCKALREKYSQARRDVPPRGQGRISLDGPDGSPELQ